MKTLALLFALPLLIWQTNCSAEINPAPGATDPRVRVVIYDRNDVIKLIGYEGHQTHLRFSEGEEFIGVGAGDTGGLDVTAVDNDTWIKPKAELVSTNFDLKTSKRIYHFDYESKKKPPKNRASMIYSITFVYPEEEARQQRELDSKRELTRKLKAAAENGNRNYWYCGNAAMKPVETYDDGMQTHIRFSRYADFPAIFVENEDQTESLINFHIDPDTGEVVIHRIGHRFVLRRGGLVGCIENRGFIGGGGKRKISGTVKDTIIRETKPNDEEAAGRE